MKIKSIGANIAQKISAPFNKKNVSTNPFENNVVSGHAFKSSVLPFADVFQSHSLKTNKLKMISGSVVSAVSNFGHKVSQPIVDFAHNVKMSISNTVNSIKSIPARVVSVRKNMSEKISNVWNNNWSHREDKIDNAVHILSLKKINEKASVADLKATWLNENEVNSNFRKEVC